MWKCVRAHVKVFLKRPLIRHPHRQRPCDKGVALLVACVSRRYPDVQRPIPVKHLQRLALASSGSVRDFFRLIRSVCTKAHAARVTPPLDSDRWVQLAEQMLATKCLWLKMTSGGWLRVRKTHGTGLASMTNLHRAGRVFDSSLILNYRNGRDWCDVQYLRIHNSSHLMAHTPGDI